jgi:hypothetical protein
MEAIQADDSEEGSESANAPQPKDKKKRVAKKAPARSVKGRRNTAKRAAVESGDSKQSSVLGRLRGRDAATICAIMAATR